MMARNSLPLRLSRPIKVWFNDLLGRMIGLCDMVLMDVYRLPYLAAQHVAHRVARSVGDISWLLRDFPRLSAYKLAGANWTIVFVGGQQGLLEICHLFFPGETLVPQEIGRIALWSLAKQTQQWVAEGVDLVVCELSPCCPYQPKAAMTFTVPTWIQQVLDISGSRQELLAGGKRRNVRKRLYQAQKAGFGFRFTQSKTDFDYFYDHMYVPFVRSRHGDLALVTPYQDQWRRWFSRGGLILIAQNDQPVAGTLCYVRNGTCFLIESGVLEANPQLVQQNVNTFVVWSALIWAHSQGITTLDLGGSHACLSNGAFTFKRNWGTRVARRKRICGSWTLAAQSLSPALQDHMNRLGFISEIGGKFYSVILSRQAVPVLESDMRKELVAAHGDGLDGIVVVSANQRCILTWDHFGLER